MLRRSTWSWLVPAAIYLLGTVSFLPGRDKFESFPLDDAWIHQVYARAFATGHGFEYNTGEQEAGATSPLWVIVTSPAHWIAPGNSRVVVAAVMAIGALLGLASILLFSSIVRRATGSRMVAGVAASLLALEPRLLFSSLSGMETMLLLALWLGALLAMLARRWLLSIVLFSLMVVTRPESLVVVPVYVVVFLAANREWSSRQKLAAILVLGVPFAAWGWFCHATTGHFLPNTYYVKARGFELTQANLANAWHIVSAHGFGALLLFPIGILVCIAYLVWRRRISELAVLVGAPLLYMAGVAATRVILPHGYYWTRWLDPVSILLSAVFATGCALLLCGVATPGAGGRALGRRWRVGVMAAAALGLVLSAPRFAESFADRRDHLRTDARAIHAMNVRAGLWIRDNVPADAIVGVNDAGAIRYFGGRRTVDLMGINHQALAFSRVSFSDALVSCDWLAIFPSWYRDQWDFLQQEYHAVSIIEIPVEEYTLCDCPSQAMMAVLQKKSPR